MRSLLPNAVLLEYDERALERNGSRAKGVLERCHFEHTVGLREKSDDIQLTYEGREVHLEKYHKRGDSGIWRNNIPGRENSHLTQALRLNLALECLRNSKASSGKTEQRSKKRSRDGGPQYVGPVAHFMAFG